MSNELQLFNDQQGIEVLKKMAKAKDNIYKRLSEHPKPQNIKRNKYAGNSEYLPIGYIESILDTLFLSWDWEVSDVKHIFNGICVYGTLTVLSPNGMKIKRAGVGSVELQVESKTGKLAMDLSNSASGAMNRDAARAEAYALKNAAAKLGNKLGRSLNREWNLEHISDDKLVDDIYGE